MLLKSTEGDMIWGLKFDVVDYYAEKGVKCFFPEVEVRFVVASRKEHYHVPVLLGPYSYSTYRGS
jgi:5-hydroxyisourate hydrolase